jgi:hypothetical protein
MKKFINAEKFEGQMLTTADDVSFIRYEGGGSWYLCGEDSDHLVDEEGSVKLEGMYEEFLKVSNV